MEQEEDLLEQADRRQNNLGPFAPLLKEDGAFLTTKAITFMNFWFRSERLLVNRPGELKWLKGVRCR